MVFICNFPLKYKFNGNPQKFKWVQTHWCPRYVNIIKINIMVKLKVLKKKIVSPLFLCSGKTFKRPFSLQRKWENDLLFRVFFFPTCSLPRAVEEFESLAEFYGLCSLCPWKFSGWTWINPWVTCSDFLALSSWLTRDFGDFFQPELTQSSWGTELYWIPLFCQSQQKSYWCRIQLSICDIKNWSWK